ncbi:MAG: LysR family transcriptional regulator [Rhodobiaceae bacterium]|nr:LysR family transcriptional regulator [Rhodobiaceae bacterium]MDC3084536.1 LysR family transcriptional regulator [Gammaproteobacteria bacterium]RZO34111.1 MAG: LysR family transcriptional regulator [Hyphomicrobiales bacterium]|tara:strand:+ start:483 stop:1364 length:882 start_codon:yes stop_codon:yes gene_type:complete
MDWDRLRIFHIVADAGSFSHASEEINTSQSAISRQISNLEYEVGIPLFHRHPRGLILTEQGELLYKRTRNIVDIIKDAEFELIDSKERPSGDLSVTTTVGLGTNWLTPRLRDFTSRFPEINLELRLTDAELDVGMREADIAIRFHKPQQLDLIQRKLFTVHFHLYASPDYLDEFGTPSKASDLKNHKIVTYGRAPDYLKEINWLEKITKEYKIKPILKIGNIKGLHMAVSNSIGIAMLPDYLIGQDDSLIRISFNEKLPEIDTYLTYAEERRNSKRIAVFREFIIEKGKEWSF